MTDDFYKEIHKDGDWQLVMVKDTPEMSFISHACPKKEDNLGWIDGKGPQSYCGVCRTYPPVSVMGLYMLHNWDRLTK